MKVLHVIDSLNIGGAESILVQSINEMVAVRPEYKHFIVAVYDLGDMTHEINEQSTIIALQLSKLNCFSRVLFLREFVTKNKIDIIHSHLLDSTLISRIVASKNVNLVSTYHSPLHDPAQVNYSNWRYWMDRITYSKKHFLIFVSNTVRDNICKRLRVSENYKVVPNFVSEAFQPVYQYSSSEPLKIVTVGNLKEVKNHILAIRAFSKLKSFPITLDIYGEGHLYSSLKEEIEKANVKVTLKGRAKISSDLLSNYDLFLMTSLYEGMPLSLIEAMKTGLPSLLPYTPTFENVAGQAAIYYDENNEGELSERILNIYKNKRYLEPLSARAIEQSKTYSIDNYLLALIDIYESFKPLSVG